MSKLGVLALISALTGCSVMLVFWHFVYTGDLVASSLGYFVSLFVLPFSVPIVMGLLALKVFSSQLVTAKKWSVVVIPTLAVAIFLGYAYWALQYGPH